MVHDRHWMILVSDPLIPAPSMRELWETYRRSSLPADATREEIERCWRAFHGGITAFAKALDGMAERGDGDGVLAILKQLAELTD